MAIQCDHEKDNEIEELFKKIDKDEKGQLDILVNSAFKGANVGFWILLENFKELNIFIFFLKKAIFDKPDLKFWENEPVKHWDDINNVGLR